MARGSLQGSQPKAKMKPGWVPKISRNSSSKTTGGRGNKKRK